MAVMFATRGCGTIIVVDACTTGAVPGTLFEVPTDVERKQSLQFTY